MGFMDKLKTTANDVARSAQDGIARGQAKFDTTHTRGQANDMFRILGQAYYVQRVGRATPAEAEAIIAATLPHIEAAEATLGQVPLPDPPGPLLAPQGPPPAPNQGQWSQPSPGAPAAGAQWATPTQPSAGSTQWATPTQSAPPSQPGAQETSWATATPPPEQS